MRELGKTGKVVRLHANLIWENERSIADWIGASETAVQSKRGLAKTTGPKWAHKRVPPVFQGLVCLSLSLHSVLAGVGNGRCGLDANLRIDGFTSTAAGALWFGRSLLRDLAQMERQGEGGTFLKPFKTLKGRPAFIRNALVHKRTNFT